MQNHSANEDEEDDEDDEESEDEEENEDKSDNDQQDANPFSNSPHKRKQHSGSRDCDDGEEEKKESDHRRHGHSIGKQSMGGKVFETPTRKSELLK